MNQIVRPHALALGTAAFPFTRPLYRLTVEQYHRMAAQGVLPSGTRVELLEGLLVVKMTLNPPHVSTVTRLNRLFSRVLPEEWVLRIQSPITLKRSEPEPDLAVAVGPESRYFTRHPAPRELAVVVEVADSSLIEDRTVKGVLYAGERIREYWIVNLNDSILEVYSVPRSGKNPVYQEPREYGIEESVRLTLGEGDSITLAVKDFFPPATV